MLQGVTCTSAKAKYSHANTRDIKVHNLSLALYGSELLMETELTLNWGRRYAIIGPNGCGKSTLLTVIGQRMVPLPRNIDVFHVREEIEVRGVIFVCVIVFSSSAVCVLASVC